MLATDFLYIFYFFEFFGGGIAEQTSKIIIQKNCRN